MLRRRRLSVRRDSQSLAAVVGDHDLARCAAFPVGFEGLPEPEHVGLDGGRRARRNVCSPRSTSASSSADSPPLSGQQQPGQRRALLVSHLRHLSRCLPLAGGRLSAPGKGDQAFCKRGLQAPIERRPRMFRPVRGPIWSPQTRPRRPEPTDTIRRSTAMTSPAAPPPPSSPRSPRPHSPCPTTHRPAVPRRTGRQAHPRPFRPHTSVASHPPAAAPTSSSGVKPPG
jgi:hypothetical protein